MYVLTYRQYLRFLLKAYQLGAPNAFVAAKTLVRQTRVAFTSTPVEIP